MAHTWKAKDMTTLHSNLCSALVHATPDKLDVITSVDVQLHNCIAEAESMAWEFNLKDMWLTPSRWTMMINQYIDVDELRAWIDKCAGTIGTRGRGIAVMRTKTVAARGGAHVGNKETRRWGSCMLAVSYKAQPAPQITLYSRTSYLGYIGALDLSVAWMCGRYLAQAMGVPVESFRFVWYNEAIQWHYFKSLAFLLNHPEELDRGQYRRMLMKSDKKLAKLEIDPAELSPALKGSRKWLQGIIQQDKDGVTLGDMNYNTFRRIRRRFHTEVKGYEFAQGYEGWSLYKQGPKTGEQKEFFKAYLPLPDTLVEDLDFRRLGLPLAGLKGIEYDEGAAIDDEEDEE